MPIKELEYKNFAKGLQTKLEDQSIDRQAMSNELNFVTTGDKMEIRRGYAILGNDTSGSGRITGLAIGRKSDGTEIPFRTRARKIEYYNSATDAWVEIGTNTLESAADGEDISLEPYASLAGNMVYLGSPNSHLRKIVVANPDTALDHDYPTSNFQGKIRIKRYSTFLFDRAGVGIKDKTQLYRSKLDKDEYTDYTQISTEQVGTGDASTKTFTGTLNFQEKIVENCEDAWNEAVDFDVTSTADTTDFKVGTASAKLVVAAGASAGDILATEAVTSMNIKNSTTILLWIKSTVNTASGDLQLLLDDTANCASPIESLNIPALLANVWKQVELTLASPASLTAVISVGIKMVNDLGAFTLNIDDVKTGSGRRTCLQLLITDGVEAFYDDKNGILTGDLGGTGTINYSTGAFSVTFITAPPNTRAINATYRYEDSAIGGIVDFRFTATRVATEGFILPQNDAGDFQNIFSYNDKEYCMHDKKTFVITISADDTNLSNLLYRSKVGISNWRAAVETGDGIYYIDDIDANNPQFRLLTIGVAGTDQVIPLPVSPSLNLADYLFDLCAGIEWGDYILFACRTSNSTTNNRVLVYNKIWKSWDVLEYFVSTFAIYNGALIAGDSISNNVFTLFSGLDDSGSPTTAFAETKLDDLDIEELKKSKHIQIQGQIGPEQIIAVYASIDRGTYTKVGQILGDGDYVEKSQSVNVGSLTLGRGEIGGGSTGISAYNYWKDIKLSLDRFFQIKIKLQTDVDESTGDQGIGYFSFSTIRFYDIRKFQKKLPFRYRAT